MNKKGMTLMEVLVSLVLISIVMIFVVNLLADLKNEGILSNKRNEDTLTRASLINVIEADLIDSENYLVTFKKNCDQKNSRNTKTCYEFVYKNNTSKYLYVSDIFIAYGTSSNMEKWDLNYGNYDIDNITINYVGGKSGSQEPSALAIHIPVTGVDASAKNKFDIELTALSSVGRFSYAICNGSSCTEQTG